jgi:hypothetical protein
MERIDPLGRTLADPPPFRETVRPGGVWLPTLPRLAVAGRPPVAPGRPPAAGLPAAVPGRLPVAGWPAVVPGRLPAAGWPAAVVPGRLPVVVWPAVVPGRLPVVVWPAVVPERLPVVVWPAVAGRLPVVAPWEGVEACDCAAPCAGADFAGADLAGALGWEPPPPPLGLCWPQANAGTTNESRSTSPFCKISSLVEVRFITAS